MAGWNRFVCVDWSTEVRNRQAWVAELGMKRVAPLEDVSPALPELLSFARALPGRSVIAIDAALGVPRHYLDGARAAVPEWSAASDFLTWLALAIDRPGLGREVNVASAWRREIDAATGAKSPFIVSGIPGTVGSGTRALWAELAAALSHAGDFAVWPFDGSLDLIERRIAIAEMYPRVCYALALAPELPAPLMTLGKTSREVRERAIAALEQMPWVREHGVALRDLELARQSEHHFDAMISAAGLLRCVLEGHPLERAGAHDPVEGEILGLAPLQLAGR